MPASEFHWPRTAKETVALTNVLSIWLKRAGVTDGERRSTLAVGIADSLTAAALFADELERMLAKDPTTIDGADAALSALGVMDAWLFGELKRHVAQLEELWDSELMTRVAEHLPPDADDDEQAPAV